MKEQKIRSSARISINKLAEYMMASPSRRRGIIRDQKRPLDFVVARYIPVYEALTQCLVAGGDPSFIHSRLQTLYDSAPRKSWQIQDTQLSIEALEASLDLLDDVDFRGLRAVPAPERAPLLRLSGVDVSVRPEVRLLDDQERVAGLVKISLSKTFPMNERSAPFSGVVLHQYASEVLTSGTHRIDHRNCITIDLFSRSIYTAPRAILEKRRDIGAACEEIALRWQSIN